MSTDELLDAQIEFEKSRTASVRLLDSLAQKIGIHRAARHPGLPLAPPFFSSASVGDASRFLRRPAVAALAAIAAGYLLGTALRQIRR